MDHILENEGKPVPDPSSTLEQSRSVTRVSGDDEDEDLEALSGLGVLKDQSAAATGSEAKVSEVLSDRS
jgi:hypothetical protein